MEEKNKWAVAGLIIGLVDLLVIIVTPYAIRFFFSDLFNSSLPPNIRVAAMGFYTMIIINFLPFLIGIIGIVLSIKGLKSLKRKIAIVGIIFNSIDALYTLPQVWLIIVLALFGV